MSPDLKDIVQNEGIEEIKIFNIKINPLRRNDFLSIIEDGIKNSRQIAQFGVNSATINDIVRNDDFRDIFNNADLVHIDGMSVVLALRFFGYAIPERVATPDLADDILVMANREKMSVFLFGAKEATLALCKKNIEEKYPDLKIVGSRNGYFEPAEEEEIFKMINKVSPDILLLGMSSPRKELFFENYRNKINAHYILGVGGYFDIIAGLIKRAPRWMQDIGLEWFFRLLQEPRRLWRRYLIGIHQFFWLVINEKRRRAKKQSK